ncbi:hypothetical protein QE418_003407 [Microbacterium testaceum]|uniref:hypothetical protein n=1 Tax=Microbacterium TaxID=33882 RepID=UPI00277EC592|nr:MULTISPECIES: hypothetical protein [Microbacterium]MDQ1113959.1 hypothetical protein [Microbacterium testaceum]MDR6098935.1 hypothetical protein [Microbacterium sp. SORGH_AS_0454]
MAAMKPLEYRILIEHGDDVTEVGRVELPFRVHRDGTISLGIRAYRRAVRRTLRKIARAF